jgi:xanthine/CO dehydrogenase XdhC/CoxF family maturation factor
MSTRALVEQFTDWVSRGDTLVLATVIDTEGSTYSKAGRHLLMRADGSHAGLISGGCLEGDLATHAKRVLETGEPALVTYDMRDDADDLWGIGLGCNGLMRLLLQRLDAANDFEPFIDIARALASPQPHTLALATASKLDSLPVGSCLIDGVSSDPSLSWPAAATKAPYDLSQAKCVELPDGQLSVLHWRTRPWVRLLILGGAPDAVPVTRLGHELGWEITLADHRQQYLEANDFSAADTLLLAQPDRLGEQVDLDSFEAIVIMSHHLETDGKYLHQLVNCSARYIGLLGPLQRKQKLLDDMGAEANDLREHLRGPVGLDINADTPETIALALVAEIKSLQHC